MPIRPDRSAGFTLMEVLVAFVILSLSVAALLQIYAGSARTTARAKQSDLSSAIIRERLADFESMNLSPGRYSEGIENGLAWRIEVAPAIVLPKSVEGGEPEAIPGGQDIVWVTVRVTDNAGRVRSVSTARWRGEAFPDAAP